MNTNNNKNVVNNVKVKMTPAKFGVLTFVFILTLAAYLMNCVVI